jgi:hypothetical protein
MPANRLVQYLVDKRDQIPQNLWISAGKLWITWDELWIKIPLAQAQDREDGYQEKARRQRTCQPQEICKRALVLPAK